MTKNKSWIDLLPWDVANRLANCRTLRKDLKCLVDARYAVYRDITGYDRESALIEILDLLDCNGCYIDITADEYDSLKRG